MKLFPTSRFAFVPLVFFGLLFFTLSCDSDKNSNAKISEDQSQEPSPKAVLSLEGNYHLVYCTSAEFDALIKKLGQGGGPPGKGALVLKNYITPNGLTLHGWLYKQKGNSEFEYDPDILFTLGREEPVKFSSGSYLGDFICSRKALLEISNKLKIPGNKYNYVILKPEDDSIKGHIKYVVFLSETEPKTLTAFTMDPTGVDLNPIPPKGSNALEEPN